eukprot:196957_1
MAAPKEPTVSARTFFVGGNWKCNGTVKSVTELCDGLAKIDTKGVDVLVSPVAIHIPLVQSKLGNGIIIASQNVSATGPGAFTGELSAESLVDLGLNTTLIGHSERRKYYGDTNEVITKKVARALSQKLNAVCCLGETLDERKSNKVEEVCFASLKAIAEGVGKDKSGWGSVVIAYEPVWAIGTGVACDKEKAQATQASLRKWFKDNVGEDVANTMRIIYGGSVKPANCDELIAQPDIDGFLVGGAALKADSFGKIIAAVQKAGGKSKI